MRPPTCPTCLRRNVTYTIRERPFFFIIMALYFLLDTVYVRILLLLLLLRRSYDAIRAPEEHNYAAGLGEVLRAKRKRSPTILACQRTRLERHSKCPTTFNDAKGFLSNGSDAISCPSLYRSIVFLPSRFHCFSGRPPNGVYFHTRLSPSVSFLMASFTKQPLSMT